MVGRLAGTLRGRLFAQPPRGPFPLVAPPEQDRPIPLRAQLGQVPAANWRKLVLGDGALAAVSAPTSAEPGSSSAIRAHRARDSLELRLASLASITRHSLGVGAAQASAPNDKFASQSEAAARGRSPGGGATFARREATTTKRSTMSANSRSSSNNRRCS